MTALTTQELRRLLPDTPPWLKDRLWTLRILPLKACAGFLAFWRVGRKQMPVSWWARQAQRKKKPTREVQRLCEAVSREGLSRRGRPNLFILVRQVKDRWMVVDGNHRLIGALIHKPTLVRYVGVWYGVDQ